MDVDLHALVQRQLGQGRWQWGCVGWGASETMDMEV
jgi:hypothetical protein